LAFTWINSLDLTWINSLDRELQECMHISIFKKRMCRLGLFNYTGFILGRIIDSCLHGFGFGIDLYEFWVVSKLGNPIQLVLSTFLWLLSVLNIELGFGLAFTWINSLDCELQERMHISI